MANKPEAGDLLLSVKDSWLSRTIRWFQSRKTGAARVSHAAVVLGQFYGQECVIEALHTVQINPLSKYDEQRFIIYRPPWPKGVREGLARKLIQEVHKGRYGYLKLLLIAADSLIPGQWYPFTKILGIGHFKVCSHLFAWGAKKLGYPIHVNQHTVDWRIVTPDFLDDVARSQDWVVVKDRLMLE